MHLRGILFVVAVAAWATLGAAPAGAQGDGTLADDLVVVLPGTGAAPSLDPNDFAGALMARGEDREAPRREARDASLAELKAAEEELAEYDPWMGFNEKTFDFNHGLDTHVIKPVAKFYDKVVPNLVFEYDATPKQASRIDALLHKLEKERGER